jgi:hypothetical protein
MGLLDDAIREHLDLKRRRGADPTELERLEREALGPVRRSPHEAYETPLPEGDEHDVYDEHPGEVWSEPEDASSFADRESEPASTDLLEDWEVPERGPIQGAVPVEPDTVAPPPPAPPSPAEAPPTGAPIEQDPHFEQETVEHDVEAELGRDPEQPEPAERDDMLEETPEFLQDTPDHDRLWFEQRPPRDFDLDR